MMDSERFYRKVGIAFVLTVGFTVVLGYMALGYVKSELIHATGNTLDVAADSIADKLDRLLYERHQGVLAMAQSNPLQRQDPTESWSYLMTMVRDFPLYEWIEVTDAKGQVTTSTDLGMLGEDRSQKSWFRTVKDSEYPHIRNAQQSENKEISIDLTFSAPIMSAHGEFLGSVSAHLEVPYFEEIFLRTIEALRNEPAQHATVEWQFLDSEGLLILDSILAEEGQVNLRDLGLPSAQEARGRDGSGFIEETHLRRHQDVVTGYARTQGFRSFPDLNWTILVRMDREAILRPLSKPLWIIGGIGSLMILPLIGFLFWAIRGLGNKNQALQATEKGLTDAARELEYKNEDLMDSTARLESILHTAADGIITIDHMGHIETFNVAAEKIFQYSKEEVIGNNISMLMPAPYKEEHDQYIETYHRTNERKIIGMDREVKGQRKDGTIFPLELAVSETKLRKRTIFTGIVRDITDRKDVEADLIAARDRAQSADRLKSEFLATISHEIRTPMNGVIGMTGLLLDSELTHDQRECTDLIKSSSESLLLMINDLLDFTKIENGKLQLEEIPFDLRAVVDDLLDLMAVSAEKKGLELVGLVYADVPTGVQGDPGRLRQILLNLVGNAIKFTHDGEVVLQVTKAQENDENVEIRFDVIDTGIGISQEILPQMFESFTQADSSTSRKYGGTGLGLAICQQLTHLLGGEIGVSSSPGAGSLFWFTIRLAKGELACHDIPRWGEDRLKGLPICVVNGNFTNLMFVEHYAETWEVQSTLVETGGQALEVMNQAAEAGRPFSLAICDFQMSDMSGEEFAKKVNLNARIRTTPLVLMASMGQKGDAQKARRAGFAGYLTKPLHRDQLYQALSLVLETQTDQPVPRDSGSPAFVTRHVISEVTHQLQHRILVADENLVNQMIAVRALEKLGYHADVVASVQEVRVALNHTAYLLVLIDGEMGERDESWKYGASEENKVKENDEPQVWSDKKSIPFIGMITNVMEGELAFSMPRGMDACISKPLKLDELEKVLGQWAPHHKDEEPEEGGTEPSSMTESCLSEPGEDTSAHQIAINEEPSVDQETLAELRCLGGEDDPAFLNSIIEQFLEDAPRHIAEIRRAVDQKDSNSLMKAAHAFKGGCRNMGTKPLAAICFALEELGKQGVWDNVTHHMAHLEKEDQRVSLALKNELMLVSHEV
jgi:PAS domain S-box-containing protein